MASIQEWLKGITFSLFGAIMFYGLWTNVFSNILNYIVGQDSILGTFAWISFVLVFLFTVPIYLIYSIMAGSGNEVKTKPLELLKAVGIWSVMMPFIVIVFKIIDSLVTALNDSNILDSTLESQATASSWLLALILVTFLTALPFYYILIGYGQLTKKGGNSNEP